MSNFGITLWMCIKLILLSQLQAITCFPIDRAIVDTKPDLKHEVRYPNGTIIGKYSYTDKEGNPISVKYYADHSSYGVELNSFKLIQSSTSKEDLPFPRPSTDYMKPMEPLLDLASEIINFNKKNLFKVDKNKHSSKPVVNTPKYISKDTLKMTPANNTAKVSSPEYETFYQNEVKAPKQCEKDKVRVYLVKEKRKLRSVMEENQAVKFCDQS